MCAYTYTPPRGVLLLTHVTYLEAELLVGEEVGAELREVLGLDAHVQLQRQDLLELVHEVAEGQVLQLGDGPLHGANERAEEVHVHRHALDYLRVQHLHRHVHQLLLLGLSPFLALARLLLAAQLALVHLRDAA